MEFLAATIEARCVVDRDAFSQAFDRIADGKDAITRADLSKLLGQSPAQAKEIISEIDENNDGVISREEFLTLVEEKEDALMESLFEEVEASSLGVEVPRAGGASD